VLQMKPRFTVDQNDRWVQIDPKKHFKPKTRIALDKLAEQQGFLDYPEMKEFYKEKTKKENIFTCVCVRCGKTTNNPQGTLKCPFCKKCDKQNEKEEQK